MLNEGEYGLRFTAIYRDEFNTFATTFFNETVSVLEPHRDLHITDILQFGLIVAVIILAIYGAFRSLSGSKKQKFSNKAVEEHSSEDWLKGTAVEQHINKKKQ